MKDYETAASVLMEAVERGHVNLAESADIYSNDGKALIALLERFASVEKKGLGVPAQSKLGAIRCSPLGAMIMAMKVTIEANEKSRSLVEGKTKAEIAEALVSLDAGE